MGVGRAEHLIKGAGSSREPLNCSKSTGSDFWDFKGEKKSANVIKEIYATAAAGALFVGNFTWIPSLHGNIGNGIWLCLGILGRIWVLVLWGWIIPGLPVRGQLVKMGKIREKSWKGGRN